MNKTTPIILVAMIIGAIISVAYYETHIASTNTTTKTTNTLGKTIELYVLSGAGLMKPMNELIQQFQQKYHVKVIVDYGGSGEIFAKLKTGEGDVFVPGSYYYAVQAIKDGFIIQSTLVNITKHIPVIAVPINNPEGIHSLKDLLKPGFKIAIGDPKACAIGKVAYKIFKKNGLWSKFEEKMKRGEVVLAPTVNQLLLYLVTGQVKAAIIWEDLVTWSQAHGKIKIIEIPASQNIIKTIPAAVTIYAERNGKLKIAEEFVQYISSDEGLKIWEKWGFKPWHS